jgi:hypothetical protein
VGDFVGRDHEIESLTRLLDQVRGEIGTAKPGRCLLMRGRRRIGKSALTEEFVLRTDVPALFYVAAGASAAAILELAAENVARTGLEVELIRHDLFDGLPPGPWDLVVSNPPYVEAEELSGLDPEVRDWEPRAALVADGAVEAVARHAAPVLAPGGALALEVGAGDTEATATLLAGLGYAAVAVTRDLAGRDRVVEGIAPGIDSNSAQALDEDAGQAQISVPGT